MIFILKPGKDNSKIFNLLREISPRTKRIIKERNYRVGQDLRREAIVSTQRSNKTGRIYRFKGRTHRSSGPGQSHANRTWSLTRSIGYAVSSELRFGYGVGNTAGPKPKYAEWVELGTRKMAARPTLLNAILNSRRNTLRTYQENYSQDFIRL